MTTTSRVRVGAMAAALAAFAVSGCSGTGGSASTAQGAKTAAKADASGALDVCALLPVATVASITGQSLTGSTSNARAQPGALTQDQISAMEQAMVKALQPRL